MASRYIKSLFIFIIFLSLIPPFGCKKNSTSPPVDDLTRPVIWLNTFELSFAAIKSEGNPDPQILQIKNTGIDTLDYDISCEEDWIKVEPSEGTSSGEINGHEITAKKTGLEAREEPYTATIKITDPNSYNNPQEVEVSMTVSKEPPPKIGVSPKNLNFTAQKGGSDPPSQTIEITNTGDGTLKYDIESDKNWLSVEPDNGSSKTATRKHSVSVSIDGLSIGTHSGTLTIRDPDATNSPQTVSVSVDITKEPPPEIWTNTGRITFSATAGGANPPSATLRVKNNGGGTLNYSINWDAAWLSVKPTSGTSGGGANSHTVSVDISGKNAGRYNGMITIEDPNASNTPYTVDVVLDVNAPLGNNRIGIDCNPSSAFPNDTVSIPISISGNHNAISAFGLNMTFDPNMFQYQSTSSGNLTGGWSVAGAENNGTIIIGGYKLGNPSISVGSQGTIAVVTLRVTGGSYPDGQTSQLSISNYTDDIAGMSPEPANTTFTLKK